MTDGRTDGRTDARGKTVCLPTLSGGDIKKRDCTICVAKTKALISCEVSAQLISTLVFVFAKI